MWPDTTMPVSSHITTHVALYYYICVLILLYMCPHTILNICVVQDFLSYYYTCGLIYCICVLILLNMCPTMLNICVVQDFEEESILEEEHERDDMTFFYSPPGTVFIFYIIFFPIWSCLQQNEPFQKKNSKACSACLLVHAYCKRSILKRSPNCKRSMNAMT